MAKGKGNPFRVAQRTPQNPIQMLMGIAQQARQIQNNPQELGTLLLNRGVIDQNTYDAIKGMNSPSQIGNYLMNNGILGQQQAQQYAQAIPQVQQMMN